MSINNDPATQSLIDGLNSVHSSWANISSFACGLPTPLLANVVNHAANLVEVMMRLTPAAWEAMYDVIRCDAEGLADLTVDELIDLAKTLKELAALELATATEENMSPELYSQLVSAVEDLCEMVDEFDPGDPPQALIDAISGLLDTLKDSAPLVMDLFLDHIDDALLEMVGNWATSGSGQKLIATTLASAAMSRLGSEAAKKLAPALGAIVTLAEAGLLVGSAIAAFTLSEVADNLLGQIIEGLSALGSGWPNCGSHAFVCGGSWAGGGASLQAYVKCGSAGPFGGMDFGDPIQVPFSNGSMSVSGSFNSSTFNSQTGCYEIPYSVSNSAITSQASGSHCMFYIEVTATDGNGISTTTDVIAGVDAP